MKTFNTPVREAFRNGLRPDVRVASNVPFLEVCRGLKASEFGLVEPEAVTQPAWTGTGQPTPAWPFPQILWGRSNAFLGYADAVRLVASRTAYTTQGLSFYQAAHTGGAPVSASIVSGGVWHWADFGEFIFATNGNCIWMVTPHIHDDEARYTGTLAKANTCCRSRGTLLIGGMSGNRFALDEWENAWALWRASGASEDVLSEDTTIDMGWVMWTTGGAGAHDFPFAVEMALLGYPSDGSFAKLTGLFTERIERGAIGFVRCPLVGSVKRLLPLGNDAVVYGENAIGILTSLIADSGAMRWGYRPVMDVGIAGRGHACGDENGHVFVDSTGVVWTMDAQGPHRLGFKEFMAPLLTTEATKPVVLSLDPEERETYIGNGETFYLLRGAALSEQDTGVSSLVRYRGSLLGQKFGTDGGDFEVLTERFDHKQRGLKRLANVEVGYEDLDDVAVTAQYRYGPDESYRADLNDVLVNVEDGNAYVNVAATDHKLKITGTRGSNGRIDYAHVRWQLDGRKHVRGLYEQE